MASLTVCMHTPLFLSSAAICVSIPSKILITTATIAPFTSSIPFSSSSLIPASSLQSSHTATSLPVYRTAVSQYSTFSYAKSSNLHSSLSPASQQFHSTVRRRFAVPNINSFQLYSRSFSSKPSSSPSPVPVTKASFLSSPVQWYREQNREEWIRWLKEGAQHYWHGTKLFGKHTSLALQLLFGAVFRGKELTRSERRFLQIHAGDWLKMGPFIIIVIVPFLEFSLPFLLKWFPDMLPSTFNEPAREEEKRKKQLLLKLEAIKFLQESTLLLSKTLQSTAHFEKKSSFQEFDSLLNHVRKGEKNISSQELLKYIPLFNEELTIDKLSRIFNCYE